jgi:biopolymer transport protein ExbB
VWEIILAAGWPIWPLIIASIISLAIIGERFWALRSEVVAPSNLLPEVQKWLVQGGITKETLGKLDAHSLLGQVFASALANSKKFQRGDKRGD